MLGKEGAVGEQEVTDNWTPGYHQGSKEGRETLYPWSLAPISTDLVMMFLQTCDSTIFVSSLKLEAKSSSLHAELLLFGKSKRSVG